MQIITDMVNKTNLSENQIIGSSEMENSKIIFHGCNNICYFEKGVKLVDSKITFNGNNSIVYFAGNCEVRVEVGLYSNCIFSVGENSSMREALHIIGSEWTNVFIGNDVMISFDFWCRTADPHLIYDIATCERINLSKSIYIGDHVWIGQNVMLLKGTQIGSGSIVGAKSLVAGKKIKSNSIYAGNPAKLVREHVFFDRTCVHEWTAEKTLECMKNTNKDFVFERDDTSIEFDDVDIQLRNESDITKKLDCLKSLYKNTSKNRFAI